MYYDALDESCFEAYQQLVLDVEAAINKYANHHDEAQQQATKFVLIGECVDLRTGERAMVPASTENLEYWEVIGLASVLPEAWAYV